MSAALNLCTLGLILVVYSRTLAAIRARAFIGVLALVAASMVAGRSSLNLTTSINIDDLAKLRIRV